MVQRPVARRGKPYLIAGLIFLSGLLGFGLQAQTRPLLAAAQLSPQLLAYVAGHGDYQVRQMLLDRPAMAAYETQDGKQRALGPEDRIWQWAAKVYGSTINGAGIVWDKSDISDKPLGYMADHDIPAPGSPGAIRIRTHFLLHDGTLRPLGFEEGWSYCVFELINIQKAQRFLKAYTHALKGEMNRAEYIRYCKEAEYQSLAELKRFYLEVWKPWAAQQGAPSTAEFWEQDLPPSYDAWIALYEGTSDYQYWEDYYDRTIAPAIRTRNQ